MQEYWYQKQLRILQTVLREKDLADYDAAAVVAYMKKVDANCLVVNAGGVVDFFPNKTALGRPNRFMNSQDILQDLTKLLHQNGMHIIVRVDFRGVEKERYEQMPDWFGQSRDGKPLTGWNDRIYRPCYLSTYGSSHAKEFLEKLLSAYELDGVWENCVTFGYGPCYCPKCRAAFRAYSGKEIPMEEDYHSEAFGEYRSWKETVARAHMQQMRDTVKRFGQEKAYVSEIFGMFHVSVSFNSGIDLYDAKDMFDFLVSPLFLDGSAQPDRKYEDYSHVSSGIKFLKAIAPEKQCVALTGGNGTKWRYVKAPQQESRIWMWEAVSAGGNLWNNYFNGQCPELTVDRRNAFLEKDSYRFLKANEDILNGQIPVQDVGIFYSRPTRDRWGNDDVRKDEYGSCIRGVERMLYEQHIAFQFIPDLDFSYERIRQLKALILPNAACISDAHMDILRQYVREGGGLVATYRTSLYDEQGKKREDFGLQDLFGCSFTGVEKDTGTDSYQRIANRHPVLADMEAEKTEMVINEEKTLICRKVREDYTTVCTYVPLIYNQPPEFAWIPEEKTEYPTILAGCYGKGKVVYFSNQTDKACYTNGHEDLIQSFYNAVSWVKREAFSFETNAPESVHVNVTCDRRNASLMVISLVNTTGGQHRPIRALQPVYDIELRLSSAVLKQYRFIRCEGKETVVQEDKGVMLRIPCLREFVSVWVETEEKND